MKMNHARALDPAQPLITRKLAVVVGASVGATLFDGL